MAVCTDGKGNGCRGAITPAQAKTAKEVRNEQGKLTGIMHWGCWFKAQKKADGTEKFYDSPTVYEEAAERRTATDLTEDAKAAHEAALRALSEFEANREALRARIAQKQGDEVTLASMLDEAERHVKGAQEHAHLTSHQLDLAVQRAAEDHTGKFDDWRDPSTLDI